MMNQPEHPDVETASELYAKRFSGATGKWFLEVQAAELRALLADMPPGGRVLDVGGGHAQLIPVLLSEGYETVVLGSARDAVGRAAPYVQDGRVRFDVGAPDRLPYRTGAFDAVVSVRLLAHLDRWRAFIAEACRVARRAVVIDYPSLRSLNRFAEATFSWKRRIERDSRPFITFHPDEVDLAFRESGYEIVDTRAEFVFPMVLHRVHRSPVLGKALEGLAADLHLAPRWGSPLVVRAEPQCGVGVAAEEIDRVQDDPESQRPVCVESHRPRVGDAAQSSSQR